MRWKEHAKSLCKEGICAKFMSSTLLQNKLLDTGNKTIVECCWDKMWGTGVPLHVDNCLDKSQWASQGILGEVLQEIRTKLMNSTTCPPIVETPADSVRQASIDVPEYDSLKNSTPEQQIMETGNKWKQITGKRTKFTKFQNYPTQPQINQKFQNSTQVYIYISPTPKIILQALKQTTTPPHQFLDHPPDPNTHTVQTVKIR